MSPKLTMNDIERRGDDCIMYCEEDLITAIQVEAAQIEKQMQARFARTFGGALYDAGPVKYDETKQNSLHKKRIE